MLKMLKTLEAQAVQEPEPLEEIDMVDFAIACIRGLRQLKVCQDQGQLDSVAYHFIARDIQKVVEEVTRALLLFGGKRTSKIKWVF